MTKRSFRSAGYALACLAMLGAAASVLVAESARAQDASPATAKTDDADPKIPPKPENLTDEEYYELLRLLADTLDQVERNYVKEVSRRELIEAAIDGVVRKLDQYSNYIPPEELERFRTGVENEFGGIGIQVAIRNGRLTITSPIVGTPAYRAGLLAGDVIISIEGEETGEITLDQAVKKLKGKVNTEVTFTVLHAHDKSEETVTVKRELVRVDSVLGDLRKEDDSWNWYIDEENKIGYIRLTSFSRRTSEDLRRALKQLESSGVQALVLDMRFNPGGLLTSAVEVCDMFVDEGVIVSTRGRNTPERVRKAHRTGTYKDFPMAVLVNRYSASASEIVSACLQDHERAVVVGERTWGKGSVQNIINLEGGNSALKLTTASYHRPSGKNIHKFKGATDADDWGVLPSDGFKVRLSDQAMGGLLEYRRERDVVQRMPPTDNGDHEKPKFKDRQLAKAIGHLMAKLGKSTIDEDDPRQAEPRPPVPS